MDVHVEYLGGVQFQVEARPDSDGGFHEGTTAPELPLAALGTCAGYYAAEYLNARPFNSVRIRVRVEAEKAKWPTSLASFRVEVKVPSEINARHREGVVRDVHSCLVHSTPLNPPEVELEVKALESPARAAA